MDRINATPLSLTLAGLKAFAAALTEGSLMREATLQVIAEFEKQSDVSQQRHQSRKRHWD